MTRGKSWQVRKRPSSPLRKRGARRGTSTLTLSGTAMRLPGTRPRCIARFIAKTLQGRSCLSRSRPGWGWQAGLFGGRPRRGGCYCSCGRGSTCRRKGHWQLRCTPGNRGCRSRDPAGLCRSRRWRNEHSLQVAHCATPPPRQRQLTNHARR